MFSLGFLQVMLQLTISVTTDIYIIDILLEIWSGHYRKSLVRVFRRSLTETSFTSVVYTCIPAISTNQHHAFMSFVVTYVQTWNYKKIYYTIDFTIKASNRVSFRSDPVKSILGSLDILEFLTHFPKIKNFETNWFLFFLSIIVEDLECNRITQIIQVLVKDCLRCIIGKEKLRRLPSQVNFD